MIHGSICETKGGHCGWNVASKAESDKKRGSRSIMQDVEFLFYSKKWEVIEKFGAKECHDMIYLFKNHFVLCTMI